MEHFGCIRWSTGTWLAYKPLVIKVFVPLVVGICSIYYAVLEFALRHKFLSQVPDACTDPVFDSTAICGASVRVQTL